MNGRNCALAAVLLIYTSVVNTLQIAPPVASMAVAEATVAVAGVGMLIVARMGGRGGGRYATGNQEQPRAIAAAAATTSTEIVEYDADTSNVTAPARAPASGGDRGGRAGARFGPRRDY